VGITLHSEEELIKAAISHIKSVNAKKKELSKHINDTGTLYLGSTLYFNQPIFVICHRPNDSQQFYFITHIRRRDGVESYHITSVSSVEYVMSYEISSMDVQHIVNDVPVYLVDFMEDSDADITA